MSEFSKLQQSMEGMLPKAAGKTIGAALLGMALGKSSGGFGKKETHNRMVERQHAADIAESAAKSQHVRDMAKGQQFHNYALEKARFAADTVHEFATKYPNAIEIVHEGTKLKRSIKGSSKRQETPPPPAQETPSPIQEAPVKETPAKETPKPSSKKGNKSGKGKGK